MGYSHIVAKITMAAGQKSLTLQVIHGSKKHNVRLQLPEHEAGDALCVKHLTDAVHKLTEIPAEAQKLIYKGKSLKEPQEELSQLGLKNGVKVMLIGKKPSPQDDESTRVLNEVEKNTESQQKKLGDITYELDGIHRTARKYKRYNISTPGAFEHNYGPDGRASTGYLNKDQCSDSVKILEKRLAGVAEALMRLLEKLDALRFEESNKGSRGKRKTLVDKIQVMLSRIDGLSRGLNGDSETSVEKT